MQLKEINRVFLQTTSPNLQERQEAERILTQLETQLDFIMNIPFEQMTDPDQRIVHISAIFFKNSCIKQWEQIKAQLAEILLKIIDMHPKVKILYELVDQLFRDADEGMSRKFIDDLNRYFQLEGNDIVVLSIYDFIFNLDMQYKRTEELYAQFYLSNGEKMIIKLRDSLTQNNHKLSVVIMKIVLSTWEKHPPDQFILRPDVFCFIYNASINILVQEINSENAELLKLAGEILNKSTFISSKKLGSTEQLVAFVRDPRMVENINCSFLKIISRYSNLKIKGVPGAESLTDSDELTKTACDYFSRTVKDEDGWDFVKQHLDIVIFKFIFVQNIFCNKTLDNYNNYPDNYLLDKYTYEYPTLKSASLELFENIIKKTKQDLQFLNEIFHFLLSVLENYSSSKTYTNAVYKYGALRLLTFMNRYLFKYKKKEINELVYKHIVLDIATDFTFLKSQICYFLQFFGESDLSDTDVFTLYDWIYSFMTVTEVSHGITEESREILNTEATLAMCLFTSNEKLKEKMRGNVAQIIYTAINLSSKYEIDALFDLIEQLAISFPEEVKNFAPGLCRRLIELVMNTLDVEELKDKDLTNTVGYLKVISDVALLIEIEGLALEIYTICYDMLNHIFTDKKYVIFPEAIVILVNIQYKMKRVEPSMLGLLNVIISAPQDELLLLAEETSSLIDNMLSFGSLQFKDNPAIMSAVLKYVNTIMSATEDDFIDDDHIAGCRILQSIILNLRPLLDDKILRFMSSLALCNQNLWFPDMCTDVCSFEVVLLAFSISPKPVIEALGQKGLHAILDNIYLRREKFVRVYDLKILFLFIGELFKLDPFLMGNFNELKLLFLFVLSNYPKAVIKREKLIKEEGQKEAPLENSSSSDYESDEYDGLELEEDIYFTTQLDEFDPVKSISDILQALPQNTIGSKIIEIMNVEEKGEIRSVLDRETAK